MLSSRLVLVPEKATCRSDLLGVGPWFQYAEHLRQKLATVFLELLAQMFVCQLALIEQTSWLTHQHANVTSVACQSQTRQISRS
jgi:hypothetical protein